MAGGTEQQLVELISRLDRRCFDPFVVCLYGERVGSSLYHLSALKSLGVSVYVLDLSGSRLSQLLGWLCIIRLIWRIRPDVIHSVNYHSNWLMRVVRPVISKRIPLITSVYVEYTRKQLRYERLLGWLDTTVVCNSHFLAQQLQGVLSNRPTSVIANGIDLERFTQAKTLHSEERIAVFVGRISRQKAPHIFVEAVGRLRQHGELPSNFRAVIIGECTEKKAQSLVDETIRRYGLADIVEQLPVSGAVEHYFQQAGVSVLPSLWEGLPNVVLESLACGCPVIVSASANRAGVVQPEATGWVVPSCDADAFASALKCALSITLEERKRMSYACRRSVSDFTVVEMVNQYQMLYMSLMS